MKLTIPSTPNRAHLYRSLFSCAIAIVALIFFFFQAEDGIREIGVTGVQTCALPISLELEHEHSLQDPELRRCEPDALSVLHQMEHPLDKRVEVVVELGDLLRLQTEGVIRVLADLRKREAAELVPLADADCLDLLLGE